MLAFGLRFGTAHFPALNPCYGREDGPAKEEACVMEKPPVKASFKQWSGLAYGLGIEFSRACVRVNPPIEAIQRLLTPDGQETMDDLVRRAVDAWMAEQSQRPNVGQVTASHSNRSVPTKIDALPANHYCLHISCAPFPSFADLEKKFGIGNVTPVLSGGRPWILDDSCEGMDRTPGGRIFLVKDFDQDWKREAAIEWGKKERSAIAPKGYRPSTNEEEYEFHLAHPELFDLTAFGSHVVYGGSRCVACLLEVDGRHVLECLWEDTKWTAKNRCLFVCK